MSFIKKDPASCLRIIPKIVYNSNASSSTLPSIGTKLLWKNYTISPREYTFGSQEMNQIVENFLSFKKNHPRCPDIYDPELQKEGSSSILKPPPPTLLTFEFKNVYTIGRRDKGKMSKQELDIISGNGTYPVEETQRGGQTTFHGLGQLVAYPIIDLNSFYTYNSDLPPLTPKEVSLQIERDSLKSGIPVRCYVELLERSVIASLAKGWGLDGTFVTENTGVWTTPETKICAMGVQVRRHITSHGIGLNISTDLGMFQRITACGLPDKQATSVLEEIRRRRMNEFLKDSKNNEKLTVGYAAKTFAEELAEGLGLELEQQDIPLI